MVVIGDIHGCADSLAKLLEMISHDEKIYSTGDLIDRGPDSKGVVSLCMARGVMPVMGNHEHMLIDYLDETGIYGPGVFLFNGGGKTLLSYNYKIPADHLEYIRSFPLYIETEHFFLSHAGIHFQKDLNGACDLKKNIEHNIIWNRGPLADIHKLQIVGHTPVPYVKELQTNGEVVGINIDTGCVYSALGKLSALRFPANEVIQVDCLD